MSDLLVRLLAEHEWQAASGLFFNTLHRPAADDTAWSRVAGRYQPDRMFGAFEDEVLVGTARSFDAELTVPGGAAVPVAAVSDVGVRADRTRRGVLSELMRHQLAAVAELGMPLACLHASETMIYGRFGYGVASRARDLTVDPRGVAMSERMAAAGEVELVELDELLTKAPEWYAGLPRRAGTMTRSGYWWAEAEQSLRRPGQLVRGAVHHGPHGVDGFAIYAATVAPAELSVGVRVVDLHCGSGDAFRALWRFLLSVDLVDEITAHGRALDEPLELLLSDPRKVRTTDVSDSIWLRLVDVPAALRARDYGHGELVIEVRDSFLPANSGRYLVGAGKVGGTRRSAQLALDVDTLSMVFMGDRSVTELVMAGRVAVLDPAVLPLADAVFGTSGSPWCGTFF